MNFNAASQILSAIFEWTWRTSLHASVLIVLVLLIQLAGGKWLTARWRYALGVLVLVRLLLPVVPASAFSIFNLGNAVLPIAPQTEFGLASTSAMPAAPIPAVSHGTIAPLGIGVGVARKIDGLKAVRILWLLGLTSSLLTVLRQHRKFARRIAAVPTVGDEGILSLLESCKGVMGVRRQIRVVIAPQPGAPALFGFLKPRLLLPESAVRKLDDRELRMVFLHELAHVKRGDILLNWAIILARSLHWFNPLVWLALRRLRADRELVCDAMVMARLADGERRVYGNTLIKLLDDFSGAGFCPSLAPVINHKHEIKRRVTMIAQFKPAGRVAVLLSAVIVVALCCFTFTRAAEKRAEPSSNNESRQRSKAKQEATDKRSSAPELLEMLRQTLEEQNRKVSDAQAKVDKLRRELGISDRQELMILNPETVRRLESERIRAQAEYASQTKLLEALLQIKADKGSDELRKVILTVAPDEVLSRFLQDLAATETTLAKLRETIGAENPEFKSLAAMQAYLDNKVNTRIEGILAGLHVRLQAVKAHNESLRDAVEEAKKQNGEMEVKSLPYLEAKRSLENQQKVRDAIALLLLQETVDMQLPGAKPREK